MNIPHTGSYDPTSRKTDQYVQGEFLALWDTPPPIVWISAGGTTCADAICTGPGPDNRIQKEIPNLILSPSLHSYRFLHIQDPTSFISGAYSVHLGGPGRLGYEHSRGFRTAPSLCACGCIRPTECGSVASGNAAPSQESVRPPIPPNRRLFLDVDLRMVVLRPAVCSD